MTREAKQETTTREALKQMGFLVTKYPLIKAEREGLPYQLNLTHLAEHREGEYSVNNGIVCWVMDCEIYAAPCTSELFDKLKEAGFGNGYFYVPFSNGDLPYHRTNEWQELCAEANRLARKQFEKDSEVWCDEHHIGSIDEHLLESCLKVPHGGIPVEDGGVYSTYYPRLNEICLDIVAISCLGSYSYNAGRVAFVYRDGHTYLSKNPSVMDILEKAGYRKQDFLVPLSGPEKITDSYLRYLWDNIPEVSR